MKLYSIHKSFLPAALLALCGLAVSCDDFLTVLPESDITEDQFWETKGDLLNVRAGAYKQLATVADNIIYWGELRSDNVKLQSMSNTTLLYLQQAILRPTNSNFDWAGLYTGISYCNLILSKGAEMTEGDTPRDPSFTRSEFSQYEADIKGLRALYYFYLVRAFRDVPYVENNVQSDAEARKLYIPVSSGEAILGEMCRQLEECVGTAFTEQSFNSSTEKKGYFTQTAIHALLADMYLWRGCMLKNYSKKTDAAGHARKLNLTDVEVVSEEGDTTLTTADGELLTDEYADAQSTQCFQAAVDHANQVLVIQMRRFKTLYDQASTFSRGIFEITQSFDLDSYTGDNIYPLYHNTQTQGENVADQLYSMLWATKNNQESILEIQFNSTQTNTLYSSWYGSYSGGSLSAGTMVASDALVAAIGNKVTAANRGLGKTDLRALETFAYNRETLASTSVPIHKNIATQIVVNDLKDMSLGFKSVGYRTDNSMNWPIYRLSDVMLIKAEALARLDVNTSEAHCLVNHLYARNCPTIATADTTSDGTGNALVLKIYNERQREFVGEGKRWFDLVRQAEAGDYYSGRSISLMESLSDYVSMSSVVVNRMHSLWSFYCPITDSEMRVEGVDAGGYLVQNPVWEKYSEIKK